MKICDQCQKNTSHAEIEESYELPDVLIVSIQRFERNGAIFTKECDAIMPSDFLQFEDDAYSLSAVVTHFG